MSVTSSDSLWRRIGRKPAVFALLAGLALTLPMGIGVIARHATIAPLNYLVGCCGWQPQNDNNTIYNPIPSDVTDFVLADRFEVKQAYAHHQIALWNPSYFGGEVFLGNLQSTVLHPVNLFYLVTNELNVQTISTLLSLFFAVFFMTLFLIESGRSRSASALGALALGGSCFAIFWAPFGMMTWMIAGMPMCLLLLLKWYKTQSRKWLALLTFGLGLQWFFGHIQFSFLVYTVVTLFAIYYFFFETDRAKVPRKQLLIVGAALITGILLGSVQLLPFFQQSKIGHRAGVSLVQGGGANWSQAKVDLKHFISPYIFQTKGQSFKYLFNYGPFRFSVGLIPALLAMVGIVAGLLRYSSRRRTLFYAFLFMGGMLWMWGSIPEQILDILISNFKSLNPEYFMALPIFAASVLAAYGFDETAGFLGSRSIGVRKKPLASWWLLGGLVIYILMLWVLHVALHRHHVNRFNQIVLGAYTTSLVVALGAMLSRKKIYRPLLFLPVLAVLVEALIIFFTTQPLPPKSIYYAGNPYFDYIIKDSSRANPSDVRIISPFSPQTNLYYGLSTLNGYDSLYAKRTMDMIHAINYPQKTFELSTTSRNAIYIGNLNKAPLLQNLGVEYVIDRPGKQMNGWHQIYQNAVQGWAVYKSDLPTAEVYFAESTIKLDDSAQLKYIKNNTLSYHQAMVYENLNKAGASHTGDSVSYDMNFNKITASSHAQSRRLLFIAETYRPQWKAYIDGKPARIYKADYNFMALLVPAGKHHITMVYDPASFKLGVALSTITAAAVLVYTIPRFGNRIRIKSVAVPDKSKIGTNGRSKKK